MDLNAYLYLLGLASGLCLLPLASYRDIGPGWLRIFVTVAGVFLITRYVSLAIYATTADPNVHWLWRRCWLSGSVGLTLPCIVAVDQLLRHPAMTPKKLITGYAPFLVCYLALILFAPSEAIAVSIGGWMPRIGPFWGIFISAVQGVFSILFIGGCAFFLLKISQIAIRRVLAILILTHGYLAFDGLSVTLGQSYSRPFLLSEILMLIALWYAFRTASDLRDVF